MHRIKAQRNHISYDKLRAKDTSDGANEAREAVSAVAGTPAAFPRARIASPTSSWRVKRMESRIRSRRELGQADSNTADPLKAKRSHTVYIKYRHLHDSSESLNSNNPSLAPLVQLLGALPIVQVTRVTMDINLIRTDGEHKGDPDLIREWQRKRSAPVEAVAECAALDLAWRERQLKLENIRKELNAASKKIGKLKAANNRDKEAQELIERTAELKRTLAATEAEVRGIKAALDVKLLTIGNMVHESVVVSNDEADNAVVRVWGEGMLMRQEESCLKNHVDLCVMTDIVDLKKGALLAGGRGFILRATASSSTRH
ncbi:hypothetical protein PR202_gb28239 [Eleusine coracana subsp. coracana]|uniref:Serine-tRNA synthetase type1 N-terminal domain-containing protein n=1 Tax=Eleusine coracana subsp. coracana TaxID=191504 RepID=A0AAV5FWS2_ELECO|nr:hypothetical protein PR202_gb28239 [Eleusine coracana subsp. coracana]